MEQIRGEGSGCFPRPVMGVGPLSDTLLASAVSLMPGVRALGGSELAAPRALVAGFAMECALKAYLASMEMNEQELSSRPFGHALRKLWSEASQRGLGMPAELPAWAETLDSLHSKPYHLRYPTKVNGLVLPGPEPMTSELEDLLNAVRARIQR